MMRRMKAFQNPQKVPSSLSELRALAATGDGKRLIVAGNSTIEVWDVEAMSVTATWACPANVSSLAISPDDRRLAIGDLDGAILLWDLTANNAVGLFHDPAATAFHREMADRREQARERREEQMLARQQAQAEHYKKRREQQVMAAAVWQAQQRAAAWQAQHAKQSWSNRWTRIVSKSCSRCGRPVPIGSQAGQRCPHCGAFWSREIRR